MRFHEFITEQHVYRVDSKRIPDFNKNLKTYYHNADYTISGRQWFPQSKGKIKGIYAQDKLFTALYATGPSSGENSTRYVATYNTKPPTVYFDKKDIPRLKQNRSYITVFDANRFKRLPSGEWFSSNPGKPVKQNPIQDPFEYIKSVGWKVEIVDDLKPILKDIQQRAEKEGIKYGAEGMGFSKDINEDMDLEPLYHASLRIFEPEIMSQGLKPGGDTRLFSWSQSEYVYLTPDPNLAKSFVDPSVIEPKPEYEQDLLRMMEQGGVLFIIDQNKLDKSKLYPDPHWTPDPDVGDDSYAYKGIVSPKFIIGRKYFDI